MTEDQIIRAVMMALMLMAIHAFRSWIKKRANAYRKSIGEPPRE